MRMIGRLYRSATCKYSVALHTEYRNCTFKSKMNYKVTLLEMEHVCNQWSTVSDSYALCFNDYFCACFCRSWIPLHIYIYIYIDIPSCSWSWPSTCLVVPVSFYTTSPSVRSHFTGTCWRQTSIELSFYFFFTRLDLSLNAGTIYGPRYLRTALTWPVAQLECWTIHGYN